MSIFFVTPARVCMIFSLYLFLVPVTIAQGLPWSAAIENTGPLPAFHEVCFSTFDAKRSLIQVGELHQWFDVLFGQPQGIVETNTRVGKCAGIEGLVRLKSPWLPDGGLRFAVSDYNRLQIHLFRGEQGVTLVYHEDDLQRWAGYITKRKSGGITPVSWHIAATDDWRNRRTFPKNDDQYELRCLGEEVVLTRGDIVLIRVPFAGLPDDVLFQGKAAFHHLSIVRTRDFLADTSAPHQDSNRAIVPAVISWTEQLDDQARADRLTDGSMRLQVTGNSKRRNWIVTRLPRDALHEIVLEIVNPSPGAGIYLGNGKDGPRRVLRYVVDRRSRQLCLMARHDDDADQHDFRSLNESPLPTVADRHWLRLVFGAEQLRWWLSPDGIHWSEPAEPVRNLPSDVTHFGLHSVVRREGSNITLRRISVRPLPAIAALADSAIQQRAVAPKEASLANWLVAIEKQLPAGVEPGAWRRACALRTLASGCNRALGNDLLMQLTNESIVRQWSTEDQFKLLDNMALLLDVWDDNTALARLAKRYQEIGQSAFERGVSQPYSLIRRAAMTAPIATRHQFDVATETLLRAELIQLTYAREWRRIVALAQMLRFFQLQQKAPLLDWSTSMALRNLPIDETTGISLEKQKEDWREPFVEDVDKDAYNFLAQLRVELDAPGREDAARTIAALENGLDMGLAPFWHDKQLFVSPAVAIRCAVRDEMLQTTLAAKYAEVAALRARHAISRSDRDALELLGEQFPKTDAATTAHLWLADHDFAAGQFTEAVQHYRTAELAAPDALRDGIAAKLALARSLAEARPVKPMPNRVEIGGRSFDAEELERLSQELAEKAARDDSTPFDGSVRMRPVRVPAPANYTAHRRARFDGPAGNNPNREFVRDINRQQLDWVDRQLGVSLDGQQLFVCNRFQVSAYDLQSHQRIWQIAQPPGQIQFAQESTFTVSRPLLTKNDVFVRLLYGTGSSLACVDRSSGQYRWAVTTLPGEEIVSDPFFLQGSLSAFTLTRREQENVFRLVTYDHVTGFVQRSKELFVLRDSWRKRRYCEFVAIPGGVVVGLSAVTARIDSAGRVKWLRKHISLPADEESPWATQYFQPPIIDGERIYFFQPGVRTLDCVSLDTGELIWSRLEIDLERVIGVADSKLICQTRNAIFAVDTQDGKTHWSQAAEGLTTAATCGAEGGIVLIQRLPLAGDNKVLRPRMTWIESDSGKTQATVDLPDLDDADPRMGPLIIDQNRFWTFWGRGAELARDVVEISNP